MLWADSEGDQLGNPVIFVGYRGEIKSSEIENFFYMRKFRSVFIQSKQMEKVEYSLI
jgi:hypothetical protein